MGGLGNAVNPSLARSSGEGAAALGKALFGFGTTLARLDRANKEVTDTNIVADAELYKSRRYNDAKKNFEALQTNRETYVDQMRAEIERIDKDADQYLTQTYGSSYSPKTRNAVGAKLKSMSTSFDSEIQTRGLEIETLFVKNKTDEIMSTRLQTVRDQPYNYPETLSEMQRDLVEIHDKLGIPPGDSRTEQALRDLTKRTALTAVDGFIDREEFNNAEALVVRSDITKSLTPEEVEIYTKKIEDRRYQADERNFTATERSRREAEYQKEKLQLTNYQAILSAKIKAKQDGDYSQLRALEQQAEIGLATDSLSDKHMKEFGSATQRDIVRKSYESGLDIASSLYSLDTPKDFLDMQKRVKLMIETDNMTDEHGAMWLARIQEREARKLSDPKLDKHIKRNLDYLNGVFQVSEPELDVMLRKYGNDLQDPGFIAAKEIRPRVALEYLTRVQNGMNPDEAMFEVMAESRLGTVVKRPQSLSGRPVPQSPDDYQGDLIYLDSIRDKLSKKEYDDSLNHLIEVKRRIEAQLKAEEDLKRIKATRSDPKYLEKRMNELESNTVLEDLLGTDILPGNSRVAPLNPRRRTPPYR